MTQHFSRFSSYDFNSKRFYWEIIKCILLQCGPCGLPAFGELWQICDLSPFLYILDQMLFSLLTDPIVSTVMLCQCLVIQVVWTKTNLSRLHHFIYGQYREQRSVVSAGLSSPRIFFIVSDWLEKKISGHNLFRKLSIILLCDSHFHFHIFNNNFSCHCCGDGWFRHHDGNFCQWKFPSHWHLCYCLTVIV